MDKPYRKPLTPDEPYPSLETFGELDRDYFFGRNDEIAELVQLVQSAPLVLLYGKSGYGKSSLLQAGVFPQLRESGYIPILIRFQFEISISLSDQVLTQIAQAVTSGALDAPLPILSTASPKPTQSLEGEVLAPDSLWEYCYRASFWTPDGEPAVPVLVFDQFEEVFTRGSQRRGELERLVAELSDVIQGRIPERARPRIQRGEINIEHVRAGAPVRVLLAQREDYLVQLLALSPHLRTLDVTANSLHLGALSFGAATDAARKPGLARSLVTPAIAVEIAARAAGLESPPPVDKQADTWVEPAFWAFFALDSTKREFKKTNPQLIWQSSTAAPATL
ncbi:MAG: ATP-binding protein [Polyangiaceae bacterium]|nr:ATP-binding protein [Polyangiaceae bacterium]